MCAIPHFIGNVNVQTGTENALSRDIGTITPPSGTPARLFKALSLT
jgi:hypothetical protein